MHIPGPSVGDGYKRKPKYSVTSITDIAWKFDFDQLNQM